MWGVSLPLDSGHGVLLIVFTVVLVAPRLGRLIHVPDLVGLIVGGMIVGPNALGLIERSGTVEALGTAGLLYLMFQAGLELDPDDFAAQRRPAAVFGALTFAVPFALGTIAHLALGFGALAALLLGSCWASHTLLTYPMFQEAKAVSNRAVSIGIAGTVVTDTAALLVLVVLARAYEGALTVASLAVQIPAMLAAGLLIVKALPPTTRWFFATIGRDRPSRFVFVVTALYAASLLAELVGVEPIIGAFLAGLAMNRNIVEGSELEHQVRQFGSTLLIPIFLVSVGMLIDPATAFTDRRTLLLATSFTLVVLVGKALAASCTAKIYHLDRAERLTLIALSVPQAAATLAAVFVGYEIGLLTQETVDAVVLVILATCLLGTLTAHRAIARLPAAPKRTTPLGKRIIVPVAPEQPANAIIELAAALGRSDSGTIYPFTTLDLGSNNNHVAALHRHLTITAEQTALAHGCEARSIVRLDLTPAIGLIHTAIENDATLIVLPWDGRRTATNDRFSHTADTLIDLANTPVIIARINPLDTYRRIILRLDDTDFDGPDRSTADLAWLVGTRLANRLKVPLVLSTTAGESTLDNAASLTSHVHSIEHRGDQRDEQHHRHDELVIRPLSHGGDQTSTLWLALPAVTPETEVDPVWRTHTLRG